LERTSIKCAYVYCLKDGDALPPDLAFDHDRLSQDGRRIELVVIVTGAHGKVFRGVLSSVGQLRQHLRGHATHGGVEHTVGDDVDRVRQVAQVAMEDAQDIAHAREHGQAVAEANELVVAAVWPKVVLVHDKQSRR
jgi:hypothetical protein